MTAWEFCPCCGGDGAQGHDCGEDSCCCIQPEENMPCQNCFGTGTVPAKDPDWEDIA